MGGRVSIHGCANRCGVGEEQITQPWQSVPDKGVLSGGIKPTG